MNLYLLYIHDARYSVPNLDTLVVRDDERALELTRSRLAASEHYRSAELWCDERLVAHVDRADCATAV